MSFQVENILEKGKAAANIAKNFVFNYTETEIKVREATNNDHWGPSGTVMSELASMSNKYEAFGEIMSTIYKRFTEPGKTWRQIYKALILLEYLVKNGAVRVTEYANDHIYEVKALMHYSYIDEKGKDQGINVRNRAKEIVLLLQDPARIQEERTKAQTTKNKYFSVSSEESRSSMGLSSTPSFDSRDEFRSSSSRGLNDDYETSKSSTKTDAFKNIQYNNSTSSSSHSGPIPTVPSPSVKSQSKQTNFTQDPFGPSAPSDDFGDFASAQGNDFGTFESAKPTTTKSTFTPPQVPVTNFTSNQVDLFSSAPAMAPMTTQNNFDILTGDILPPTAAPITPEPLLVPQSQKGSSQNSSISANSSNASQKSEQWGSGLVNLDNLKKYDSGKEKKEHKPMGTTSRPMQTGSSSNSPMNQQPMGGMYGAQQPMGGMGGMGGMYGAQQPMGGMGGMYGAQQPMGGMGGMYGAQQPMGGMGGMYGAQQPMGFGGAAPQAGMYGRPMAGAPQSQTGGYPSQMGGFPQRN